MITLASFTVSEAHTDGLGHMNHVAAIQMLEYARDGWYLEAGLWGGRAWSAAEDLGTVVVNLTVSYRKECFIEEDIQIRTGPVRRGTKSFVLEQEIINSDEEVVATGRCTSVIMDMRNRETVSVPDSIGVHFTATATD